MSEDGYSMSKLAAERITKVSHDTSLDNKTIFEYTETVKQSEYKHLPVSQHTFLKLPSGIFLISTFANEAKTYVIEIDSASGELLHDPTRHCFDSHTAAISQLSYKSTPTFQRTFKAIIGCVVNDGAINFLVVSRTNILCLLPGGHVLHTVLDMQWFNIRLCSVNYARPCVELPSGMNFGDNSFYYCETYDLTRPFGHENIKRKPPFKAEVVNSNLNRVDFVTIAKSRYCWNFSLQQVFHDSRLTNWCPIVLQGLASCEEHMLDGKSTMFMLLSKRSMHLVNPQQEVSRCCNVVCEAIMWNIVDETNPNEALTHWASFCWLYGASLKCLHDLDGNIPLGNVGFRYEAIEQVLKYTTAAIGNSNVTFVMLQQPANEDDDVSDSLLVNSTHGTFAHDSPKYSPSPQWNNDFTYDFLLGAAEVDGNSEASDLIDDIDHQVSGSTFDGDAISPLVSLLGGIRIGTNNGAIGNSKYMNLHHKRSNSGHKIPKWLLENVGSSPQQADETASLHDPWHHAKHVSSVTFDWAAQVESLGENAAIAALIETVETSLSSFGTSFGDAYQSKLSTNHNQSGFLHLPYESDESGKASPAIYHILALVVGELYRRIPCDESDITILKHFEMLEDLVHNTSGDAIHSSLLKQLKLFLHDDNKMNRIFVHRVPTIKRTSLYPGSPVITDWASKFHVLENASHFEQAELSWTSFLRGLHTSAYRHIQNIPGTFCLQSTPLTDVCGNTIEPEEIFKSNVIAYGPPGQSSIKSMFFLGEFCNLSHLTIEISGGSKYVNPTHLELWAGPTVDSLELLLHVKLPFVAKRSELTYTIEGLANRYLGPSLHHYYNKFGSNGTRAHRVVQVCFSVGKDTVEMLDRIELRCLKLVDRVSKVKSSAGNVTEPIQYQVDSICEHLECLASPSSPSPERKSPGAVWSKGSVIQQATIDAKLLEYQSTVELLCDGDAGIGELAATLSMADALRLERKRSELGLSTTERDKVLSELLLDPFLLNPNRFLLHPQSRTVVCLTFRV